MAQRRALLDGLEKTLKVNPKEAESFIYGTKEKTKSPETAKITETEPPETVQPTEGKGQGDATNTISRVAITTRIRADFSKALKRASLERQLNGQYPNTIVDILEQVLEPWLRTNGYLN